MYLIHKLRMWNRCPIYRNYGGVIPYMETKVQGFIDAKAGASASIGEKVRQCLTS